MKLVRGVDYYGPEYYRVSSMWCCICGDKSWWAHHVRKASVHGDKGNLVPLCVLHHEQIHKVGKDTFAELHQVDLQQIAKEI